MWTIVLECDGCGESFGVYYIAPPLGRVGTIPAFDRLAKEAEKQRWEEVRDPDGERWYCPTCRRALAGETLTRAVGT
jgi:hypothetical protein